MASVFNTYTTLPLHSEAGTIVGLVASGEMSLSEAVGQLGQIKATKFSLEMVRTLDEQARLHAQHQQGGDEFVDRWWLAARLCEYGLAEKHRPFCRYCFRTVQSRTNKRLKQFCPEHASDGDRGAYLRGYRFGSEFDETASSEVVQNLLDDLERRFLLHQLHSVRMGAGSARNMVDPVHALKPNSWSRAAQLDLQALRVNEILDGYPDWTELALRWRNLFSDAVGVAELTERGIAVTPRLLLAQWVRWRIWNEVGDKHAQIGRGRPAKIEKATALQLKAEGKTHAEIAEYFGVSKIAVSMFFTRLKKKLSAVKSTESA
jgi:hypothetical protein